MPTLEASGTAAGGRLHWGRIAGGAVLLEILLLAVLVPIGLAFGMPGMPGATDFTVFFVAVPIGCLAGGVAVTRWMLRGVSSRRLVHGLLIGVGATLLYLALVAFQPGGIAAVAAGYGPPLFWASNALRIAGCVLGALPVRGGTATNRST